MTTEEISRRLNVIVDAEREALLTGNLENLTEILEEKQKLSDALSAGDHQAESLGPLKEALRRNQQLFDQALAGIRNVASRIGDLQQARRSMDTYDSTGKKTTIDSRTPKRLEKKA